MNDDNFQGFNKAGKSAKPGREKPTTPELTPTVKQVFFRLNESGALTLTPQEKIAVLDVYRKAYPAFVAREMAEAQKRQSWGAGWHGFLRGVGWILAGILIFFILSLFFRVL